ncbi:gamma-glutamyltransferase [Luteolibacter marinus]|uniref:gamma-glutamyltransferase n=1 Tax=Luteolibacter marinus TaxID=2776705 RepID=UPI0018661308|nr:gamma-glutamyltransferase [Luteolibacter marinus]
MRLISVVRCLVGWCCIQWLGAATHGVVATVHPLATAAAKSAMDRGGNAVDAAVAAGLTLGVVDGFNSGIGGGCFILIRTAGGEIVAIDGRETAPAAASRDMFLRDGKAVPALSQTGALAVGVPGALAAYDDALRRFGKLDLADLLEPAAKIAEEGFELDRAYVERLKSVCGELAKVPASRAVLLDPEGKPWPVGHRLVQRDLAASYRAIAAEGTGWFYRGPFARATAAWMKENGGLLTGEDFAAYRPKDREPVRSQYRGHEIVGFPPPSSGGVHVAQILNILENFEVGSMGADSADFVHVVSGAMKLAFADRAWWLGDPEFAPVPRGLLDRGYAKQLAERIPMDRAIEVPEHGTPPAAATDVFKHTTHFTAADGEGNWIAVTATINTTFGSKVIVPGTGIVLNNEMDDFSAQPGVPNFFGLVGNEANAVAPGKRPLSSMSPTLVLKEGKPVFSAGAAGGPTIISQTLLAVIDHIDFGDAPAAALKRPRFHHQWRPDEIRIERGFGDEVIKELRRRGHTVRVMDAFGACQAIGQGPGGSFHGAHDPRIRGEATAW